MVRPTLLPSEEVGPGEGMVRPIAWLDIGAIVIYFEGQGPIGRWALMNERCEGRTVMVRPTPRPSEEGTT